MISKEIRTLSLKALRYRLYRIMNDVPMDPFDGVREYFESLEYFGGWHNFSITWDVLFLKESPETHPWGIWVINDPLLKQHNLIDAKKTRNWDKKKPKQKTKKG